MLMRLARPLHSLHRKFMRGQMILLAMRSRSLGMRLRGNVMQLGGPIVNTLWHLAPLLLGCSQRPIQPPSTVTIVPVT